MGFGLKPILSMAMRVFAAEDIACPRRRSYLTQQDPAPAEGGEVAIVSETAVVFASLPSFEGQETRNHPSFEG